LYPFKIKINDSEVIDVLKRLEHDGIVYIPSHSLGTKLTWKLKPIRPDIFMGQDSRYKDTYIALKPHMKIKITPCKKSDKVFDIIFKKLF